jgi:hypothetical protein
MALVNRITDSRKIPGPILVIAIWIVICLYGCSFPHYYYTPGIQNVPMFREKNEFSGLVAGSFGTTACFELQGGYAFPRNVALLSGFMAGGIDRSDDTYTDFMKIRYFEGAIGYYKSTVDPFIFEIYGGGGGGSQSHAFTHSEYDGWLIWNKYPDGNADISFSKIFLQPDIGLRYKHFSASFSCRISRLYFSNITFDTQYRQVELNLIDQNREQWFLEPGFTFRGGGESVKFMMQFGFAANISNPDMMYEKFRFGFGLGFNIGQKKEEK